MSEVKSNTVTALATKALLPHQQRVVEEALRLSIMIERLEVFIKCNAQFQSLPAGEQGRLIEQIGHMKAYHAVLNRRMEAFGVGAEMIEAAWNGAKNKTINKVRPGEPIFVLRAQDVSAPDTILRWLLANRHLLGTLKGDDALRCVEEMVEWQRINPSKSAD